MLEAIKAKYGSLENAARLLEQKTSPSLPPITRHGFGYCRFSTDLQSEGVSLETQKQIINEHAARHGIQIVKFYEDRGISGGAKLTKRPGLLSLIEDLQSGMAIVISNTDRLIRGSLIEGAALENLIKEKGCIISGPNYTPEDEDNPEAELVRGVKTLMDGFERMKTKQKIKQSMRYLSGEGLLRGRPSWGWKYAGKDQPWIEEPREMAVVQRIREIKVQQPTVTTNHIAKMLNAEFLYAREFKTKDPEGVESLRRSKFWPNTVRNIMIEYEIVDREPIAERKLPRGLKVPASLKINLSIRNTSVEGGGITVRPNVAVTNPPQEPHQTPDLESRSPSTRHSDSITTPGPPPKIGNSGSPETPQVLTFHAQLETPQSEARARSYTPVIAPPKIKLTRSE